MFSKNETFTVSLKIGGENIKLLIAVDDTVDEVFDRLRSAYPTCTKKKS